MSKGLFGGMFDFNRDGEMSIFERAAEFAFVSKLIEEDEAESREMEELADAIEEKEDKLFDLEMEGLDISELECMDEFERREAIENAGLDPDDYDFD